MQCSDAKIFLQFQSIHKTAVQFQNQFLSLAPLLSSWNRGQSSFYYYYYNPNWRYFSSYIKICLFSDSMFSIIDSHRITDEWKGIQLRGLTQESLNHSHTVHSGLNLSQPLLLLRGDLICSPRPDITVLPTEESSVRIVGGIF